MNSIEVFEKYAQKFDEWFGANRFAYESEVLALRKFVPTSNNGLEVGVGTGRFAVPLGIKVAVEPAKAMADIARKRGIQVCEARAEKLPFGDSSFDFVLMVTTLCFVQDPIQALNEVRKVLRPGGHNIIGMTDREVFLASCMNRKRKRVISIGTPTFILSDEFWIGLRNQDLNILKPVRQSSKIQK